MAQTAAAVQAQLGTLPTSPTIVGQLPPYGATLQYWVVESRVGNGTTVGPGRRTRCSTTASDNAATQAAALVTALALSAV